MTILIPDHYSSVAKCVVDAIRQSAARDSIVWITCYSQDCYESVCASLFVRCEGESEGFAGDSVVREYWGVDSDDREWRVHASYSGVMC